MDLFSFLWFQIIKKQYKTYKNPTTKKLFQKYFLFSVTLSIFSDSSRPYHLSIKILAMTNQNPKELLKNHLTSYRVDGLLLIQSAFSSSFVVVGAVLVV